MRIYNLRTLEQDEITLELPYAEAVEMDGQQRLLLKARIDPHVHFRTPGFEHKEDWKTAARASLKGGYTTVFDMPNTFPPTVCQQSLLLKKNRVAQQLNEVGIPLTAFFYLGADKHHFHEIAHVKDKIVGLKVYMGSTTGGLILDDEESLHSLFQLAQAHHLPVAVHAEDEEMIQDRRKQIVSPLSYHHHSQIRSPEVAARAIEKAIALAKLYQVTLYLAHISSEEELSLIKKAKEEGLPIFAETTPHHLFLNDSYYETLKGKAVVNPPLRSARDQEFLWEALRSGLIDTIGSDHAPHTLEEKKQSYDTVAAGMPGIEFTLPLLLNAASQGLLTLNDIDRLTRANIETIFKIKAPQDYILIDLNQKKTIESLSIKTKCAWSPYEGVELQGWPTHVAMESMFFDVETL